MVSLDTAPELRRRLNSLQGLSLGEGPADIEYLCQILAVWSLAIFIGSVWGLLTTPSFNPALILAWLNQHSAAVQAVSAGLLVILTLALVLVTLAYAIFTNKLGNATDTLANIAGDQAKLLASGQRAYISVEPLGIGMVVGGARVLDRVGIHNAGRLPAHNLRWLST